MHRTIESKSNKRYSETADSLHEKTLFRAHVGAQGKFYTILQNSAHTQTVNNTHVRAHTETSTREFTRIHTYVHVEIHTGVILCTTAYMQAEAIFSIRTSRHLSARMTEPRLVDCMRFKIADNRPNLADNDNHGRLTIKHHSAFMFFTCTLYGQIQKLGLRKVPYPTLIAWRTSNRHLIQWITSFNPHILRRVNLNPIHVAHYTEEFQALNKSIKRIHPGLPHQQGFRT